MFGKAGEKVPIIRSGPLRGGGYWMASAQTFKLRLQIFKFQSFTKGGGGARTEALLDPLQLLEYQMYTSSQWRTHGANESLLTQDSIDL